MKEDKKLTFEFSQTDVDIILQAIADAAIPWKKSNILIQYILQEGRKQLTPEPNNPIPLDPESKKSGSKNGKAKKELAKEMVTSTSDVAD